MEDIKKQYSRRSFLQKATLAGSLLPLSPYLKAFNFQPPTDKLQVHIFSKHLQFLDYKDMAAAAADIGFDGVELTVRPGGHVLPEKVKTELPKAIAAIKSQGLLSNMMVTAITKLNPENRALLEMAAELGVEYYRMGYYHYPEEGSMIEAMGEFKEHMRELAALNQKLGLKGAYQNHAGGAVGAAMWEVWQLLENTDNAVMGSQYDIRHAIADGGGSWRNGLRLIHERINTIVIKDFRWGKVDGEWEIVDTPLGEGMVDFVAYFKLLKQYGIKVPATLHFEYDLDGAQWGERSLGKESQKKVFEAMKRDLRLLHQYWEEA